MSNSNNYIICDLETSIDNDMIGKFGGDPYYPENFIVQSGWLTGGGEVTILDYRDPTYEGETIMLPTAGTMVGHNFKFDLAYLMRDRAFSDHFWQSPMLIWDTMVAQYVLSGQIDTMKSLNYCSAIYGGAQKIDVIKEMWNEGVRTQDMDPDLLKEYLVGDLQNTEIVYLAQVREAERLGMMPLMLSMMEATLCAATMEFNGLRFDKGKALEAMAPMQSQIDDSEEQVITALVKEYPDLPYWHVNVGSDEQLSALIFGGVFKVQEKDYVLQDGVVQHYKGGKKAGQAKTKWYKRGYQYDGVCQPVQGEEEGKAGYYGVGEDVLLKTKHPCVDSILKFRGLKKDLNTYYIGYSAMAWPVLNNPRQYGTIHHTLNTALTITGRFSSSKPNLQNVSGKGMIKDCFVSRWGSEGSILQGDYSQLEIVGQAWVTGDVNMQADIKNGIDFHCKRLAYKTGEAYEDIVQWCKVDEDPGWVKQRKAIKVVSFQKSYGAGIAKIAMSTGLPRKEVKAIFQAEDEMYSGVVQYNQDVAAEVNASARPTDKHSFLGYPIRRGQQLSVTGRRYVFMQDDAPQFMRDKGEMVSFSPTKMKNYSVQGLATGDIVPLALGMLVRRFNTDSKLIGNALLINTIHDSVMVDCKDSIRDYAAHVLKEVMEDVTSEMKRQWGLEFDLPLNVDIEGGKTWGSMKTL